MKFKSIFIFFNIVLVFSFSFIFLMPLLAVGSGFALDFWKQNWYMGVVFLLVLGGLDLFFLFQWKLFSLLEKEDWENLRVFLEGEIFTKGRASSQNIRFFINACLLTSRAGDIHRLRHHLEAARPLQARRWALGLGLPLILEGKGDPIVQYFGQVKDLKEVKDRDWVRWSFAFGLLLGQAYSRLKDELWPLTSLKTLPALRLLSYYLLNNIRSGDPSIGPRLDSEIPGFRSLMTRAEWERHLDKARDRHLLLVFLNRMVQEALDWLFSLPPAESAVNK